MNSYNTAPYFDDFDSKKGFHKVLFKPGVPVQVRELNQIQSIQKDQLEKFSNHIFKNGARISNGRTSIVKANFIKINSVAATEFLTENNTISSTTTGFTGRILFHYTSGSIVTIWYSIDSYGTNSESTFTKSETVKLTNTATLSIVSTTVVSTTDFTGISSVFVVDSGIFYYSGSFIENVRQYLVIDDVLGFSGSFKVGFDIVETVISYKADSTLLDNSIGSGNTGAPGADRQKLDLTLAYRPILANDTNDINFITLATITNGKIVSLPEDTEYSNLMDTLAERTYDESGSYTVEDFKVTLSEAINSTSKSGTDNFFDVKIENGLAYVLGYKAKNTGTSIITVPKPRTTSKIISQHSRFNKKSTINLIPRKKAHPVDDDSIYGLDYTRVSIYDNVIVTGSPTGTKIGECYLYDATYVSGTINSNAVYQYEIFDITLNAGKTVANIKSFSAPTINFVADAVLPCVIDSPIEQNLLYSTNYDYVYSFRNAIDPTLASLSFDIRKKLKGTLDGSGKISFNADANESFNTFANSACVAYLLSSGTYTNIDLTSSITVTTKKISIDLTVSNANKGIYLFYTTNRTNLRERSKTLTSSTISITLDSTGVTNISSASIGVGLGKGDVFSITSVVYDGISLIPGAVILNKNITDIAYNQSTVSVNGTAFTPAISKVITITFQYFAHSAGDSFFSIDSYRADLDAGNIKLQDIESYTSTSKTGKVYDIKNTLDFRRLYNDQTGSFVISNKSDIISDVEQFVGRKDLITIDKNNQFKIVSGVPDKNPVTPKIDKTKLALYEIQMPPYVKSVNDIKLIKIESKRYTMLDIGKLDTRLENVEYYTVLNLLEKSAADLQTPDITGFNRFKNGFVVDDFASFQAGDTNNIEFKCSIDPLNKELRPAYERSTVKLIVDQTKSVGLKFFDDIALLDFTEELVHTQDTATNNTSICVFNSFKRKGNMILYPAFNTKVNNSTVTNAIGTAGSSNINLGSFFGGWSQTNQAIPAPAGSITGSSYTAGSATQTTLTATIKNLTLETKTTAYNTTAQISAFKFESYMAAQTITVAVSNLTPNSYFQCFIDDSNVSLWCNDIATLKYKNLISDGSGNLNFVINVPANTIVNGDKNIRISNSNNNQVDEETCFAETKFYSMNASATYTADTLNLLSGVNAITTPGGTSSLTLPVIEQIAHKPPCDTVPQFSPVIGAPICTAQSALYPAFIIQNGVKYTRINNTSLYKNPDFALSIVDKFVNIYSTASDAANQIYFKMYNVYNVRIDGTYQVSEVQTNFGGTAMARDLVLWLSRNTWAIWNAYYTIMAPNNYTYMVNNTYTVLTNYNNSHGYYVNVTLGDVANAFRAEDVQPAPSGLVLLYIVYVYYNPPVKTYSKDDLAYYLAIAELQRNWFH